MTFNFDPAGRALKRIEQQFPNKPEDCCREMFQTWLKNRSASWKCLIPAQESSDEYLLADYIKTYIGFVQGERDLTFYSVPCIRFLFSHEYAHLEGPNN